MIRTAMLAALAAFCLETAGPVAAQDADDLAALQARQLFVAGKHDEAFAAAKALAEKGVPRAQLLMGFFYERGLGTAADPVQAVSWYEKAAAQGQPQALHNLAISHERGELGQTKDEAKARGMYAQNATRDFAPSIFNLAMMMIEGRGGPADGPGGIALLERAVTLGDADATAQLGYRLAVGEGVEKDMERGRRLYEVAAAQGIDWAQRDYGEMAELGEGGPVELRVALDFYRRSAAQGYGMAAFDIFEMYRANSEALADIKAEALAMCFYAEAQPPQWDGSEYDGKCDPAFPDYTPEEIAAAREAAKAM